MKEQTQTNDLSMFKVECIIVVFMVVGTLISLGIHNINQTIGW